MCGWIVDCNIVRPGCNSYSKSCEYEFDINHRYTMALYDGDDHIQLYNVSKVIAVDGKLYKENCKGEVEGVPLSKRGMFFSLRQCYDH